MSWRGSRKQCEALLSDFVSSSCADPREGLLGPSRRRVHLVDARHQLKRRTEDVNEFFWAVTLNWKPGTVVRAVWRERGENDSAVSGEGAKENRPVDVDLFSGHEMKDRTVVPDVVATITRPGEKIANKPRDVWIGADTLSSSLDCFAGNIENGDIGEVFREQLIDEVRRATTHVDDAGVRTYAELVKKSERHYRLVLIPASSFLIGTIMNGVPVIRSRLG